MGPDPNPNDAFGAPYQFHVSITDQQVRFIDPLLAIGYDYATGAGDPNFASVIFPPSAARRGPRRTCLDHAPFLAELIVCGRGSHQAGYLNSVGILYRSERADVTRGPNGLEQKHFHREAQRLHVAFSGFSGRSHLGSESSRGR